MSTPETIWLDMQLPPTLCEWVEGHTGLVCKHFASLGMERTPDLAAFESGRTAKAVILTKDADFAALVRERGAPPSIIWLRCGNCSTQSLRSLLDELLPSALDLIRAGEPLVEITDLSSQGSNRG